MLDSEAATEDCLFRLIAQLNQLRDNVASAISDVYHRLAEVSPTVVDLAQWIGEHGPEIFVGDLDDAGLPTVLLSVYYGQDMRDVRRRLERVAIRLAILRGDGQVRIRILQRADTAHGDYSLLLTVMSGVIEFATLIVDRWDHEMPIITDRLSPILEVISTNYWFVGGPASARHEGVPQS